MPDRDGYIAGVPCWVDTSQPDPEAAAEFYGGLFGWELEQVMPPEAPGKYFMARLRGGDVAAISTQQQSLPPVWSTYIWVDSADESAAKVREAGGSVLAEPFDIPDFGRMASFADPEGAAFRVWQAGRHRGANIVNEHGSVNFNVLNTRDLERAKSFYGAVFGWGTLVLDGGFTAWTLGAYGDHLEELDPGMRERMAGAGAPAGFENVVASINPITDDTPAHWGVTFAVDDADAIAGRAAELGGRVLMPPFDAPWVKMTVLADPQGATFIASQFVPENQDVPAQADAVQGS
jgi:uncharacterized protein